MYIYVCVCTYGYVTATKVDNGFNPVWNEPFDFDIINPAVAMIRFIVQDEDMFGDPNFLGQATYPIQCLKTGKSFSFFYLAHRRSCIWLGCCCSS